MDGTVFTGYLGPDYRVQPTVVLGLAVAYSQGMWTTKRRTSQKAPWTSR